MFLSQQSALPAKTRGQSLIDRVLELRRQLGIERSLAVSEGEDAFGSFTEMRACGIGRVPAWRDRRNWLTWSQSPGEGHRPAQDEKEQPSDVNTPV